MPSPFAAGICTQCSPDGRVGASLAAGFRDHEAHQQRSIYLSVHCSACLTTRCQAVDGGGGGSECPVVPRTGLGPGSWGGRGSGGLTGRAPGCQLPLLGRPAPSHHAADWQHKQQPMSWPGAGLAVPGGSSEPGAPWQAPQDRLSRTAALPDGALPASGALGGGMWHAGVGWGCSQPQGPAASSPQGEAAALCGAPLPLPTLGCLHLSETISPCV